MKKLLFIPVLCLMFLIMQGSNTITDFVVYTDSLKSGSDTTDTYSILTSHNTLYRFQYLTWEDTGTGEVDSVKVYGTDANGNKFLCQLEYLSTAAVTKGLVTSNVGVTAVYKIRTCN